MAALLPIYASGDRRRGRPPIHLELMLRVYTAQQCFGLSGEGIKDLIFDNQDIRGFVGINLRREAAPDATALIACTPDETSRCA